MLTPAVSLLRQHTYTVISTWKKDTESSCFANTHFFLLLAQQQQKKAEKQGTAEDVDSLAFSPQVDFQDIVPRFSNF